MLTTALSRQKKLSCSGCKQEVLFCNSCHIEMQDSDAIICDNNYHYCRICYVSGWIV